MVVPNRNHRINYSASSRKFQVLRVVAVVPRRPRETRSQNVQRTKTEHVTETIGLLLWEKLGRLDMTLSMLQQEEYSQMFSIKYVVNKFHK